MSHPFQDPDLPLNVRVDDLMSRLTLDEKAALMNNAAPAIERLGIPTYDWWSECLHGVGRAGRATVFPQAIGLAATFDVDLVFRVATAISDEARAKHHAALRRGGTGINMGLTYWSPTINILRDPRWGRAQETYGEDPYLTSQLGVAFVKGLQGDDPKYLKLVATPKHFAAHSGPEKGRMGFDVQASPKDLWETYLPAFEATVKAGAASVMGAYTRLNGIPCCANGWLLNDVLRGQWGFEGYVVSDCGAIESLFSAHRTSETLTQAAADGVKGGCDLCCGQAYGVLPQAVDEGRIATNDIDAALRRLLVGQFRLGMFDPPERVPFATISEEVVDCDAHRALAREAAQKSVVMLKNDGLLPLPTDAPSILVTGPVAEALDVLWGNYNGQSGRMITLLEGVVGAAGAGTRVNYTLGCPLTGQPGRRLGQAEWYAGMCDLIVACLGISPRLEGEEGEELLGGEGDRASTEAPAIQMEYLEWLLSLGKPVALVLTGGSPIALPAEIAQRTNAILWVGYPGEEGGAAVADVLFGAVSPSGRLPMSVPQVDAKLPDIADYSMVGRTYRYQTEEPLYPFGFGLSYTRFEYGAISLSSERALASDKISVAVEVRNVGDREGQEVVQLYLRDVEASVRTPRHTLRAFDRVRLQPGEATNVVFELDARDFELVLNDGDRMVEPGAFEVYVGGAQPGADAAWMRFEVTE